MNDSLTIRLGAHLAQALSEISRQTGLSKGEIARQALEERLRQSGKLKTMQRHFGTVRGPRDLSTNKAYRRDWKGRAA